MNELKDDIAASIRQSFAEQTMLATLGARITRLSLGQVEIEAPISNGVLNQHNFAHAGLGFTIGDTAGGYAALSHYEAGSNVVTVEYKVNYLEPGIGRYLRAVGRVIRPGGRLSVVATNVYAIADDTKKKIAVMQGTMMALKP